MKKEVETRRNVGQQLSEVTQQIAHLYSAAVKDQQNFSLGYKGPSRPITISDMARMAVIARWGQQDLDLIFEMRSMYRASIVGIFRLVTGKSTRQPKAQRMSPYGVSLAELYNAYRLREALGARDTRWSVDKEGLGFSGSIVTLIPLLRVIYPNTLQLEEEDIDAICQVLFDYWLVKPVKTFGSLCECLTEFLISQEVKHDTVEVDFANMDGWIKEELADVCGSDPRLESMGIRFGEFDESLFSITPNF